MKAMIKLLISAVMFLVFGFSAVAVAEDTPVALTDSNGPEGAFGTDPVSTQLVGRQVLVYWNPYKSDGREKNNVVSILQSAGATVVQTTTTDPLAFGAALSGKDALVVAELIDGGWATSSDLATLNSRFTSFKPYIDSFRGSGRPVIVTEGDSDTAAGIQVINTLGYTAVSAGAKATSAVNLTLDDPADPMLVGISSLSTANGWMGFYSTDPLLKSVASYGGQYVLADKASGGWFGIIGFDYYSYNAAMSGVLVNAAAVPEPATLALLALGGLAMIRRRRRAC